MLCWHCGDEFDPIEGASTSVDEPVFCSTEHEEAYARILDEDQAYDEARYGGAPVHP